MLPSTLWRHFHCLFAVGIHFTHKNAERLQGPWTGARRLQGSDLSIYRSLRNKYRWGNLHNKRCLQQYYACGLGSHNVILLSNIIDENRGFRQFLTPLPPSPTELIRQRSCCAHSHSAATPMIHKSQIWRGGPCRTSSPTRTDMGTSELWATWQTAERKPTCDGLASQPARSSL